MSEVVGKISGPVMFHAEVLQADTGVITETSRAVDPGMNGHNTLEVTGQVRACNVGGDVGEWVTIDCAEFAELGVNTSGFVLVPPCDFQVTVEHSTGPETGETPADPGTPFSIQVDPDTPFATQVVTWRDIMGRTWTAENKASYSSLCCLATELVEQATAKVEASHINDEDVRALREVVELLRKLRGVSVPSGGCDVGAYGEPEQC